jgi:hypothetical protein
MTDDWDEHRFRREALFLLAFGGIASLLLGPALGSQWVGTGAILGVGYWTVMYDERLGSLRERLPGGEQVTPLWGFLFVAAMVELPAGTTGARGGVVLGFVAGVLLAGLVRAGRARLLARVDAN